MINKDLKIKKFSKPFPYLVIDNFFSENFYLKLEKFFPKSNEFTENNIGRMHGDTSYGDVLYNDLLNKSLEYRELHNWVYSKNFMNFFIEFFSNEIAEEKDLIKNPMSFKRISKPVEIGKVFNIKNFQNNNSQPYLYSRLDLGFGKKEYGISTGGKGPHIDNPQRLISILIYVGGYKNIEGGEHRIFEKKNNKLEVFDKIKPIKNRAIASLQNNLAFHDVNPVQEIDGQRNAFYLAISSNTKIWKSCLNDEINIKFNKNRLEKNFFNKIIERIF